MLALVRRSRCQKMPLCWQSQRQAGGPTTGSSKSCHGTGRAGFRRDKIFSAQQTKVTTTFLWQCLRMVVVWQLACQQRLQRMQLATWRFTPLQELYGSNMEKSLKEMLFTSTLDHPLHFPSMAVSWR